MRINKRGDTAEQVGVMFAEPICQHRVESYLHLLLVAQEVGHGSFSPQRQVHAVEIAGFHPRKSQSRFAQCLAWNRACVYSGAADLVVVVDQSSTPMKVGGGRCTHNPGGTPAKDY